MARRADPAIADRNEKIVEDYKSNRNQSYDTLCGRYNVDKGTLYLVLQKGGAIDKSDKRPRARAVENPPISNTLVFLGLALEKKVHDKYLDRESSPDWSAGVAVRVIGLKSAQYMGLVFKGQANLTYNELQSIATFLGMKTVAALLTEIEDRVCKSLGTRQGSSG